MNDNLEKSWKKILISNKLQNVPILNQVDASINFFINKLQFNDHNVSWNDVEYR